MEENTVTVLLLGDAKCGKSTFLSRISQGKQNLGGKASITALRDLDQPFIFELRSRRTTCRLELYDTSSPENWRLLRPDLIVFCFDINQRLSLVNLQEIWLKDARAAFQGADGLPVFVLGLKRDLRSEDDPNGVVYPQEAYRIAQEMRADKYAECSAVTGELLPEAFEDIYLTAVNTTTAAGGQSEGGCCLM